MEIEQITTKGPAFAPAHPGEVLREDVLPALGMPKAAFAEHIGVSRNTLYKLLNEEQPVTLAIAIRLGQALGNGPRFWLNLQMQHDLWIEERKPRVSVGRLTPETIIGKVEGRTSSRIAEVAAPRSEKPSGVDAERNKDNLRERFNPNVRPQARNGREGEADQDG
jgi:addiction module HigA family antidote